MASIQLLLSRPLKYSSHAGSRVWFLWHSDIENNCTHAPSHSDPQKRHMLFLSRCANGELSCGRCFLSKVIHCSVVHCGERVALVKICQFAKSEKNIRNTTGKLHSERLYVKWDSGTVHLVSVCVKVVREHVLGGCLPLIALVYCPETRWLGLFTPLKSDASAYPQHKHPHIVSRSSCSKK